MRIVFSFLRDLEYDHTMKTSIDTLLMSTLILGTAFMSSSHSKAEINVMFIILKDIINSFQSTTSNNYISAPSLTREIVFPYIIYDIVPSMLLLIL
jgi:hypothetical protein